MALTLAIGKCTLLGNYRENNEDAVDVRVFPDLTVAVVADGMGGQAHGEVASQHAVKIIPQEVRKHLGQTPAPAGAGADAVKVAVRRAVVQANEEILQMGSLDKEMKNMGTTVVLAVWRKGPELFIAGVGDSRAYHLRKGRIQQLTVDHSLAQALVEAGTISPAEAKDHRFRNVLWKYLGNKEVGEGPVVTPVPIQAGDRFLLCTDGLTGVVPDDQLASYLSDHADPQAAADGLGQLALDQGSRDNVSCVVVDVAEG